MKNEHNTIGLKVIQYCIWLYIISYKAVTFIVLNLKRAIEGILYTWTKQECNECFWTNCGTLKQFVCRAKYKYSAFFPFRFWSNYAGQNADNRILGNPMLNFQNFPREYASDPLWGHVKLLPKGYSFMQGRNFWGGVWGVTPPQC